MTRTSSPLSLIGSIGRSCGRHGLRRGLVLMAVGLASLLLGGAIACQGQPTTRGAVAKAPKNARPVVSDQTALSPAPPSTLDTPGQPTSQARPLPAADQTAVYLPMLRGRSVGLVVNHTSRIGGRHLVDSLVSAGVRVRRVFAPEHGYRGIISAGHVVGADCDEQTGLEVVSLYGARKKPTRAQLADLDVIVFDIQDVGARFYTYISTLHYIMEAAAPLGIEVIILDRPNPNIAFVDGPLLDTAHRSFVGLWPIPVVHGCTVAELALMARGRGWAPADVRLTVVPVAGYTREMAYELPLPPSPNLPNAQAVRLYPSLCLLEGTPLSVGRGTDYPFQVAGGSERSLGDHAFTPLERPGAVKPPLEGRTCYGLDLRTARPAHGLDLSYLLTLYERYPDKGKFFTPFFTKLAGTPELERQIRAGMSEAQIRASWRPGLEAYEQARMPYLLYR